MISSRTWWLAGVVLGVVFVLLNLFQLAFVDGDVARDVFGLALGCVMVAAALARYRGLGEERG